MRRQDEHRVEALERPHPRVEVLARDEGRVLAHPQPVAGEVFIGRPDGLRIGEDPYAASYDGLHAWLGTLVGLPVVTVLPTHGAPAPDGPGVVRAALARPPWRLMGSG